MKSRRIHNLTDFIQSTSMDSQEDRLIKASLATQQTASHTKKTCRFFIVCLSVGMLPSATRDLETQVMSSLKNKYHLKLILKNT